MEFKTNYILVAVKEKEVLEKLLQDLESYITKNTNNIDIKYNLEGFTIYSEIKKGHTKILNEYWKQEKIYVTCVASKSNVIDDSYIKEKLEEKGFSNNGIIIIESVK